MTLMHKQQNCKKCKKVVESILNKLYKDIRVEYTLEPKLPTSVKGNESIEYPKVMKDIYNALGEFRGRNDFVKRKSLNPVDYYIPRTKQIIDLDEPQHFTALRKLALSMYPDDLELGFDRDRWMELCKKHDRHDNSPIYRDEQRAWYETIRDFAPSILGLPPIIRVYEKDYTWCDLHPENPADVRTFKKLVFKK